MKNEDSYKPIAYLILAHTDPENLFNLVESLGDDSKKFIHLDKNSDLTAFTRYDFPPSTHFIADRVKVSWAGFNMVVATLNLIKAVLQEGHEYSHLVLLSGLDYPIKSTQQLGHFLKEHPNQELIRFIRVEDSPDHYLKIFTRHSFKNPIFPEVRSPFLNKGVALIDKIIRKMGSSMARAYKKKAMENITPCFGSQWWAITPACAKYILDFVDNNPSFVRYFKTTFAPDEYFFHTIIGNSPFLAQSTGFQEYEGRGTYRMANLHMIHPSLAYVYSHDDFDEIKASDKFFIRKVTSTSSGELISRINKELISQN